MDGSVMQVVTCFQDNGQILLIVDAQSILEDLEHHHVTLQAIQGSHASGPFLDDVVKWQSKLKTVEAVLGVWLDVQVRWSELEQVGDL